MAGLRVSSGHPQDENSAATAFRMSSSMKAGHENAIAAPLPQASSRKLQPEANQPRRRALGDITNSVLRSNAPSVSQLCKPQAGPSAAVTTTAAAAASSQPYTDEPERYAGKTWEQLEVEREQREDAAIAARVRALLSGLALWPPLRMQVPDDSSDDEGVGPLEPPAAAAAAAAFTLTAADTAPPSADDSWLEPLPLEAAGQLLPDVGLDWEQQAAGHHPHTQEHSSSSSSSSSPQDVPAASSDSSSGADMLVRASPEVPEPPPPPPHQQQQGSSTPSRPAAASEATTSSPLLAQPW